jgi:translation initiation factor 1
MGMKNAGQGGLVYSTDAGRMCPACRQPVAQCACKAATAAPAGDGVARVRRETGGRGGKAVTVIRGLPLQGEALAQLGKRLRTACGAGGTLKDGVLEVQGDHVDRVVEWLKKEGLAAKRAGG